MAGVFSSPKRKVEREQSGETEPQLCLGRGIFEAISVTDQLYTAPTGITGVIPVDRWVQQGLGFFGSPCCLARSGT